MENVKWVVNKFGMMLFALTIATFAGGIVVEATGEIESPIDIKLTPGLLSIDTAPALSFEGKIGEGEYSASNSNPNVQVSDFRGNGAGWQLLVSMSDLTYTDIDNDIVRELKGAKLTFLGTGEPKGDVGNVSESPVVSDMEIIPGGVSREVMTAANNSGRGMGTWEHSYDDVTLEIPNGNFIGEYKGTLTWTLSNAPS